VGEAVTAHLVAEGFDIRGIDIADSFDGDIDYRKCDLLDAEALSPHIQGVDAVLHLAAIPAPGRGPNSKIFQINTAGTFNVFDACVQHDVHRVVVASSINAIGYFFGAVPFEIDYLPVDEEHPKRTSDAYSFSKQVAEDIGHYFWQRDGISNTCLRFGAGLRPIDEMRQKMSEPFRSVKVFAEGLLEQSPEEGAESVRRMRAAYDDERRDRLYENQEGRTPVLSPVEHRLMTLRHNYFSFVALEDACRAMEMSLTADYDGSHPLLILDRNNTLMMDAENLAKWLYPDVSVKQDLVGTRSLVSWQRALDLINFETKISAQALFDSPEVE
jgi:hypothetical protein